MPSLTVAYFFNESLAVKLKTTYKPPTTQTQNSQTIHNSAKAPINQPQTSHKHSIMSRKTLFYIAKNFSGNTKHGISLQPFYFITSTIRSEDQSRAEIEGM